MLLFPTSGLSGKAAPASSAGRALVWLGLMAFPRFGLTWWQLCSLPPGAAHGLLSPGEASVRTAVASPLSFPISPKATEGETVGGYHRLKGRVRKLREIVKDRESWSAAVHGAARSRTRLGDCATAQAHTRRKYLCVRAGLHPSSNCISPPTRIAHIQNPLCEASPSSKFNNKMKTFY